MNLTWIFILVLATFSPSGYSLGITAVSHDVVIFHPEVHDDIEVVRQLGGNVTAIRTAEGIIVIDSFISHAAGLEVRKMIENRFPGCPIRFLVNTHDHADHIGGNGAFSDACVIGHQRMETDSNVDLLVSEELSVWRGGGEFEIVYGGPAHTDNDLIILAHDERVLIMGDLLCFKKCRILGPRSDIRNWIVFLELLIERRDEYDFVIPGHGGSVLTVNALIEQRQYLQSLCEEVYSAKQNSRSLEQLTRENGLAKYKSYWMYDQIHEDIERCWNMD